MLAGAGAGSQFPLESQSQWAKVGPLPGGVACGLQGLSTGFEGVWRLRGGGSSSKERLVVGLWTTATLSCTTFAQVARAPWQKQVQSF